MTRPTDRSISTSHRAASGLSAAVAVCMTVLGCSPPPVRPPPSAPPSPTPARGLAALPCKGGALKPHSQGYCHAQRHYMTAAARDALMRVSARLAEKHPGTSVAYMEASWPLGTRPMPPHLSHGDGRQIDLALFYTDLQGRRLAKPPTASGYRAYEPPRREADRACTGARRRPAPSYGEDPPAGRRWKLDELRTAELVRLLSADTRVRRIFIEPHLKKRLGFATDPKVRFAGCRAARHDDHLHVDFF